MGDLGHTATAERGSLSFGQHLRRIWRLHPVLVAVAALLVLAFGGAVIGTTLASFTAVTGNTTSTFPGGWIDTASNGTVTPSGYDGALTWLPGTHGPVTGQQLYGLDNGNSSNCPSSGYTSLGSALGASASSTTDTSTALDNPRSGVSGHYVCYEIVSTSSSNWTATSSPFPATRLGLIVTGVTITSGSTAGTISSGDTVQVTFNQPPSLSNVASANLLCERWDGSTPSNITLYFSNTAYTSGTTCPTASTPSFLLQLAGTATGNLAITHAVAGNAVVAATLTVSGSTATWTVGGTGKALTAQTSITSTPSTITSANGPDTATVCTLTSPYPCTPVASGTF